jgi:hypothetical protein
MRSLIASLNDHPMALLRGLAAVRGVALATNSRDDAAAQLAAVLAERGASEAILVALSPEARAAWQALCTAGGRMKVPAFTRRFGAIRPLGPGKLERERSWNAPENAAEELWFAGLVFKAFADAGDGLQEFVYIPVDLLASCDEAAPGADRAGAALSRPPQRQIEARNGLAVDAVQIIAALRETPVRVDAGGLSRPADRVRLTEGLLLEDPLRLDFLLALLQQAGVLSAEGGRLRADAAASETWLRGGVWPQRTALFEAWRNSTDAAPAVGGWNDLRRVPGLRAEGNWRNDPLIARQAVIERLRRLPPGEWHDLAAFTAAVKREAPDYQRPEANYSDWYLRDAETGRFLSGFESWDRVDGALLRFIITGPLYWLGAASVGLAQDGSAEAFRLTPAGLAWVGAGEVPDPPRPARLVIQDDLTIVAPLDVPLMDRFRLLRFSEPVANDARSLALATRHRITRDSLARARSGGVKAQSILKFLEQASGGKAPQRLSAGLERWDMHSGTVRLSRGAVLRVHDANTLGLLRADPVLRPLLGELLSAQAVLVSEANLPRVMAALQELGYDVKVE